MAGNCPDLAEDMHVRARSWVTSSNPWLPQGFTVLWFCLSLALILLLSCHISFQFSNFHIFARVHSQLLALLPVSILKGNGYPKRICTNSHHHIQLLPTSVLIYPVFCFCTSPLSSGALSCHQPCVVIELEMWLT